VRVTLEQFLSSLAEDAPPPGASDLALVLWLDRKGKWAEAHDLASEIETEAGSRLHAYLHREEGDLDNARYWYQRAGCTPASGSLDDEWHQLVRKLAL
jgi:hypothetical protein